MRGQRSPNQTNISISIAQPLLAQIDAWAEHENRPRSNWITSTLKKFLEGKLLESTPLLRSLLSDLARKTQGGEAIAQPPQILAQWQKDLLDQMGRGNPHGDLPS